ncbi:MAG: transporter substrate-binding domain-containing protein [Desulfobacula sp.]|uniref:transporter substrate-binding domain-containing protein n=1 Tax=Desulfobacula sp. TaxID=2593537 RepID=UPI0025BE1568|nr:transporter substrate-binding domain-containing protein [Desulfobacula sp.]MCD4720116.1 transporter substrate-binding domain-containing protein [Desulfobacula sp.]
MIKKIIGVFILAAVISTGALAEDGVVRMGTEGYYPPFNYFDSASTVKGFDIDIGNALCEHMKVKCEWVTTDWDGIIPALNSNKFDTIIASMAITQKRSKVVSFSKPYYFNAVKFVARKDLKLKDAMPKDLKGMTIGTQSGTQEVKILADFYTDSKVKRYPKLDDALLDLETGRVDAVLASQFVLGDWLKKGKSNCCEFVGKTFINDESQGTGIAVRKSDTELLDKLNKAIDEIVADGTYTKIREQYFSFDIMTPPIKTSVLFGGK